MSKDHTQKASPLLLCRISWLEHYDGRKGDFIYSNHGWVVAGGAAHESLNFLPTRDGFLQGFVQVKNSNKLAIERLGVDKQVNEISGVTVVWCAQHPDKRGLVIVGWYKNASVFRSIRQSRDGRTVEGDPIDIRIECEEPDGFLIEVPDRRFLVQPKGAPSGKVFGQADVCYVRDKHSNLATDIETYIQKISTSREKSRSFALGKNTTDPEHNKAVELSAIAIVIEHFKKWNLTDRQQCKCGWDLEFRNGSEERLVEVKGSSVDFPGSVRLSRNEEIQFRRAENDKEFCSSYRLAIVHRALDASPKLRIFKFDMKVGWLCELTSVQLDLQSAGIFVTPY